MRTPIRTWAEEGFRMEMLSTGSFDNRGVEYVAYEFYHHDELIFEGNDYSPSPLHDPADDDSVAGLLGFLSLKPGDTDREWFESYTPRQLAWCQEHGDHLNWLSHELEEGAVR
jgi:hypothetical protein